MTGTLEGLDALLSEGGYKHYNRHELEQSADRRCSLCVEIWGAVKRGAWANEVEASATRDHIQVFATTATPRGSPRRTQLRSLEVQIPSDPYRRVFFLVTFEDDLASAFVPGRRESKDLSPEMVSGIQQWLHDCANDHLSCPRRRTPQLPRRVLDVGINNLRSSIDLEGCPGSSPVRLHQSRNAERAPFAALSYCWGTDAQNYVTTTSNLLNHTRALPNDPPKTIADAIEVCRKIGIRYLWVDALCIIQDDNEDKLEDITNMGSIYKDASVTIVAACAEKATDGFLSNGKLIEANVQLPFYINESTYGSVYLRQRSSRSEIYSVSEPIFQRAWALQELLLSPRALIFNWFQITTKCRTAGFQPVLKTHVAFQFQSFNLPASVFGLEDARLARIGAAARETTRSVSEGQTQDRLWTSIIHEYSDRDLALFDDRLPALAGIAAELAKVWDDTYLAGFWGKSITKHLGWYRSTPRTRDPRLLDWTKRMGSPSWSWAAAPFPVHIREVRNPDAKLVDSDVQLVSAKAPFGQVKSASITLEARVLRGLDEELLLEYHRTALGSGSDVIELDYEDPKPELKDCKLVYLGGENDREIFLAVETSKSSKSWYRRVGDEANNKGNYDSTKRR
ncbi:Fc.00g011610.m01.CDS01 [Cosmosporella sp. VM-42]